MTKFTEYEFRTQPWFDQAWFDQAPFPGFNPFIPMKTVLIHCFDPRAADIPQKVAEHFGDEVYPGENVLDEAGNRVGNTRTLFAVANAGGRAHAALQSIATMDYLFNVRNVIVVHHSFCGATALTPKLLFAKYREHNDADISDLFDHDSLSIPHFEESIKYDVELLRKSPAVPKDVKLYGFFFEINTGKLTEIVRDIPA
ncbi:MAG: carbonic anhydrase [Paraburkholderia sp.]|uniref:carbonic anhydrase n=1 Tax=Paraburkholderia sp. TaxID=1926495 RepID=UPI003C698BFA